MCYNALMDTTIRNLDEEAYRALKAKAALAGKTIGQMMNEAIWAYLKPQARSSRRGSLLDLTPESYGEGSESLSAEIDEIVYGR